MDPTREDLLEEERRAALLSRTNQPATSCYAEPVVYLRRTPQGGTEIEVRDKFTSSPITFGGVTSAQWQFAIVQGQARLVLVLDNPAVIQE